jgi:hypothetical protein
MALALTLLTQLWPDPGERQVYGWSNPTPWPLWRSQKQRRCPYFTVGAMTC